MTGLRYPLVLSSLRYYLRSVVVGLKVEGVMRRTKFKVYIVAQMTITCGKKMHGHLSGHVGKHWTPVTS